MHIKPLFSIVLVALAASASAQNWAGRAGDRPLSEAALKERLVGQSVTFYDDGRSDYYADGRYSYTYANGGGTAYGYYQLNADGVVCVDFVNGFSRCDRFVASGDRLVLLTEEGERFPIRPRE